MKAFRLRLEQALSSGAALALLSFPACGGSASADAAAGASSAGTAGASGSANTNVAGASGAGTAGGSGAGTAGGTHQQLTPYPLSALGCTGPEYDGGFYGRCCAEALCYTPDDGADCVAPDAAPQKLGTFYGSGSCLCGDDGIQGPFAQNPTHETVKAGSCCYVISSISCDGRPLLVDGTPLISALTRRCDWLLADLLEIL